MKLDQNDKLAVLILVSPLAPVVFAALCWAMGV